MCAASSYPILYSEFAGTSSPVSSSTSFSVEKRLLHLVAINRLKRQSEGQEAVPPKRFHQLLTLYGLVAFPRTMLALRWSRTGVDLPWAQTCCSVDCHIEKLLTSKVQA